MNNRTPEQQKADLMVNGLVKAADKVNQNLTNINAKSNLLIVFNEVYNHKSISDETMNNSLTNLAADQRTFGGVYGALQETRSALPNNPGASNIPKFFDTISTLQTQLQQQQAQAQAKITTAAAERTRLASTPKQGDLKKLTDQIELYHKDSSTSNQKDLINSIVNVSNREMGVYSTLRADAEAMLKQYLAKNPAYRETLVKAYNASDLLPAAPDFIKAPPVQQKTGGSYLATIQGLNKNQKNQLTDNELANNIRDNQAKAKKMPALEPLAANQPLTTSPINNAPPAQTQAKEIDPVDKPPTPARRRF